MKKLLLICCLSTTLHGASQFALATTQGAPYAVPDGWDEKTTLGADYRETYLTTGLIEEQLHDGIRMVDAHLKQGEQYSSKRVAYPMLTVSAVAGMHPHIFSQLKHLDLSGQELDVVHPKLIRGLHLLARINLANNYLSYIPRHFFDDARAVGVIDMSQNVIKELPAALFVHNNQLRQLNLSNNRLRQLRASLFGKESTLKKLACQGNQLTSLDCELVRALCSLRRLTCQSNNLQHIPLDQLAELSCLERADFSDNSLSDDVVAVCRERDGFVVGTQHPASGELSDESQRLFDLCLQLARKGRDHFAGFVDGDFDIHQDGLKGKSLYQFLIEQNVPVAVLSYLQELGADATHADDAGNNALHSAASSHEYGLLMGICKAHPELIKQPNAKGELPILIACKRGDLQAVSILTLASILFGQQYTPEDVAGCFIALIKSLPSHPLISEEFIGNADFMLNFGASVDEADEQGRNGFHIAAVRKLPSVAMLLLTRGAESFDESDEQGNVPLWYAIEKGHHLIVRFLVNNSKLISWKREETGETLIHRAVQCVGDSTGNERENRLDIVRNVTIGFLSDRKAKDAAGRTAQQYADGDVAELLAKLDEEVEAELAK